MSAAEDSGGEDRGAKRSRTSDAENDDQVADEGERRATGDGTAAAPATDGAGGAGAGDEPKAAKVRRPRPKLTVEALLNEDSGLPSVPFQMKGKRFAQDNVQVIQSCDEWTTRLFPASKSFSDFLNRFGKFASSNFKEEVFNRYNAELARRQQLAEERAVQLGARSSASQPAAPKGAQAEQRQAPPSAPLPVAPVDDDDPWGPPESPPEM